MVIGTCPNSKELTSVFKILPSKITEPPTPVPKVKNILRALPDAAPQRLSAKAKTLASLFTNTGKFIFFLRLSVRE